ncbi:MAG: glucokinase [Pseudomonadota bacterium]
MSTLLIGDIGGTNARFALADPSSPGFDKDLTLKCEDYDSADVAIRHYLDEVDAGQPDVICLAAAGPIANRSVRFTNNHWIISAEALGREFGIDRVQLLNDFEAIAYSMPFIGQDELLPIGLPLPKPLSKDAFMIGVVGPGTGLGAVGLKCVDGQYLPIPSESSHGGFAPETAVQIKILNVLRERFDRVSTERLVSGPGLENLYWALTRVHKESRVLKSPAEIFAAAVANSDPLAIEAVQLFFEVLGQFAGDFSLSLSAYDGIYIGGGIAQRYPELVVNSLFRTGFERKGRHRVQLERTPTQLIMHPQPGLLGAAYIAKTLCDR